MAIVLLAKEARLGFTIYELRFTITDNLMDWFLSLFRGV